MGDMLRTAEDSGCYGFLILKGTDLDAYYLKPNEFVKRIFD